MFVPGGEQIAFSLAGRLSELAGVPTLVLWGREDRVICPRDAAQLHAADPSAEIHIARGVGHMLPLEAAAWANDHIRAFVRRLQRRDLPAAA